MILYAASSYNSDIDTEVKMRNASRLLYLSINPTPTSEYEDWNVFPVFTTETESLLGVKVHYELEVSDKSKISEFLDLFAITDQEKSDNLNSFNEGDIIPFSQIQPSNLDLKTYEELESLGIIT